MLLQWEGRLSNSRLRAIFGISGVRASEWLKEFRDAENPDILKLDTKTKSYIATGSVYQKHGTAIKQAALDASSLTEYLDMVGAFKFSTALPFVHEISTCIQAPSPHVFAVLSEAAHTHTQVEIKYRSMRDPNPHKRIISPHNIVRAGQRWHVRAFCSNNEDFRDFALGLIVNIKVLNIGVGHYEDEDRDWITRVPVKLAAHPDLTPEQETLVRQEYFSNTAGRTDTCRGALVKYYVKDVMAATDVKTQRPPEYLLAVSNINEVSPWLFPS